MSRATLGSLALTQRTPHSFTCFDVPGLAEWLQAHGYQQLAHHSLVEYGRFQRGASLLVVYHSGSVVVQGADVASGQQLLGQLVAVPPEQLDLFAERGAHYDPRLDWTAEAEVLR